MSTRGFAHDALLYRDIPGLVADAAPFLRAGLDAGELVFAMVPPATADALRAAMGSAPVRFVDMAEVGRNPARIIPAVQELVAAAGGLPVRGVEQPWWPGRDPAETAEAALHEALQDIAFADVDGLRMLCPYPAGGVPEWVEPCHRVVIVDRRPRPGRRYDPKLAEQLFATPLPEVPEAGDVVHFCLDDLPDLRDLVGIRADAFGLERDRALDLTLAANEIVTNSICHGGERGTLRLWTEGDDFVCEVGDSGHITSPMVGRVAPRASVRGGRGVWLANQLCDLVSIRSTAERGTVVRVRVRR